MERRNIAVVNAMRGNAPTDHIMANAHGNVERALWSGAPVQQRDPKLCEAQNHSCKGPKALGTRFCVGHLRSKGMLDDARERQKQLKGESNEPE
jgi:hypothetical protein